MKLLDNVFPLWGPYGKKYMGISRVVDESMTSGVRFDFTASPTVFASAAKVPNTTFMCGCRAWQCEKDYSFFSYRFDLENRDDVYSIVSFVKLSDEATLVRTEIFNNTDLIQNCLVNYFSSIEYRNDSFCSFTLPEKCIFIKATDYEEYTYSIKRPWDEQNADANIKGTFLDNNFTFGKGLGDRCEKWHMPHKYFAPFGGEKGDRVKFTVKKDVEFKDPVLVIRYRTSDIQYEQGKMVGVKYIDSDKDSGFILNGETEILLEKSSSLRLKTVELKEIPTEIELVSMGLGGAEFDFIGICEKDDVKQFSFTQKSYTVIPEIAEEKQEKGYLARLSYGENGEFHIRTFNDNTRFRRINTGCLEDCLNVRLSNNDESFDDLTETFSGSFKDKHSDNGFFHNTLTHTHFVKPHSTLCDYAVISKGECAYLSESEYEKLYQDALSRYEKITLNSDGKKYELSNELLRAAMLTNVVYPIYKHGRFIIHHTPGKRWDCLYTWDSGFIGLGFTNYAEKLSYYILDTYLSEESNKDYAFVHHGSPVPVQFYIFKELMNLDAANNCTEKFYDRLKLYYDFYLGKIRGSTTAKFKSGLLSTYDYFYSSSGMDDYPAQVAMMQDNIRATAAPVITTAQAIRIAKIMRYAAGKLGKAEDIAVYESDIEKLTTALNTYSWDENSGYYSYVLHNDKYEPKGKYEKDGENLNKGLDGIYPIVAGVCDEKQKNAILSHLKAPEEMLSPYGISAVDMTASYFKNNGYWNGNVWFSHQWFLFKSMLDIGDSDFAFEIAKRALEIWKRECEYSYYTFEMVSVVTGRGGWFHNFGGLSSPINMWAFSYFRPGTITTGFDTFIEKAEFNKDFTEASFEVSKTDKENGVVIVCMNDEHEYTVGSNSGEVEVTSRMQGELEIRLNNLDPKTRINICKKY